VFLDSIYQVIAKGPIVIVSFISTVALVGIFVWLGKDLPKIPGVVCLELAFSKERFRSIVAQWHEHGVLQTIKRGIWLDLFFALVYALFFSSLLAWSTIEPDEVPGPALIVFLSLPFVAGALDWVENLAHLYLLKGNDNLSEPLIVLAATASFIKWLLVIVAFSTSVSLFVIHVIEIRISSEAAYQGMAEWQIAFVALVLTVTFLGFLRARGKSSVKAPGILCL